jgi:hypothetical protein
MGSSATRQRTRARCAALRGHRQAQPRRQRFPGKTVAARLAGAFPKTNEGVGARIVPIWKAQEGLSGILAAPLAILGAACGLVLLIACANVANLLLARSAARHREFGIRLALGARPGRLRRQLFSESLLLAALATLAGLPLALWFQNLPVISRAAHGIAVVLQRLRAATRPTIRPATHLWPSFRFPDHCW